MFGRPTRQLTNQQTHGPLQQNTKPNQLRAPTGLTGQLARTRNLWTSGAAARWTGRNPTPRDLIDAAWLYRILALIQDHCKPLMTVCHWACDITVNCVDEAARSAVRVWGSVNVRTPWWGENMQKKSVWYFTLFLDGRRAAWKRRTEGAAARCLWQEREGGRV